MPDLLAQGTEPQHQWRQTLPADPVTLGRVPKRSLWTAPWDPQVSSLHATLAWRDNALRVRRAPGARNPIFYKGSDQQFDEFPVALGESFVIGSTTFTVAESLPSPHAGEMTPDAELT